MFLSPFHRMGGSCIDKKNADNIIHSTDPKMQSAVALTHITTQPINRRCKVMTSRGTLRVKHNEALLCLPRGSSSPEPKQPGKNVPEGLLQKGAQNGAR